MSSQDKLENVLRDIHVMISKSEAYDTDKIIVSKQDIFNLIDRLNASVYEIMDEYELTKQSRDKALRENKKEGDKIIWDASRQAEDIYAASVMYTDEALNHLNGIVEDASEEIGRMYRDFQEDMKRQQETIRENQLELKSQLQLLVDTEKYLKLIEERNREIQREKAGKQGKPVQKEPEENIYASIKPEIKINEEYFKRAGIPLDTGSENETEELQQEEFNEEGVIESTLRKVAADVQREVGADAATPVREAEASPASPENMLQTEVPAASGALGAMSASAAGTGTSAMLASAAGTGTSAMATYAAGAGTSAMPVSAAGAGASAMTASAAGAGVAGIQGRTAAGGANAAPAAQVQSEVKVNLDAEYFKRKGMAGAAGGTVSHQPVTEPAGTDTGEKLSLLDKLMGKKK